MKNDRLNLKTILPPAIIAVLVAVLILILVLDGNSGSVTHKEKHYYQFFDTVSTVYDYSADSDGRFDEACALVEETLDYYHKLFDIYNEYDGVVNLATVNRLAPIGEVEVVPQLIDFLKYAVKIHDLTDGNVNVAMGSLLSIWHDYREEGVAVPEKSQLTEAAVHTDIRDLIINEKSSTVRFDDPKMSLDVGAIAKGYTAEICARLLEERGFSSYVLDLGGNLRAIGKKPDGSGWHTGIINPDSDSAEKYVHHLTVSDTSVVTSGNYQRFYTVDGKKYHHIINKDTLFPSELYASVTVITKDSALADALSTALFNMTREDGEALLSELDEISVIWIYDDGRIESYNLE